MALPPIPRKPRTDLLDSEPFPEREGVLPSPLPKPELSPVPDQASGPILYPPDSDPMNPSGAAWPPAAPGESRDRRAPEMGMVFGDAGQDVKVAQEVLNDWGFKVNPTGDYDDATAQAVMAFQEKAGLKPTGNIDSETAAQLMYLMDDPEAQVADVEKPPAPTRVGPKKREVAPARR